MRIGLGQIVILGLLALLFFGKFPKIMEDLSKGVQKFKNVILSSKDLDQKMLESETKKTIDK